MRANRSRIVALVSGTGWHVQDLRRAAADVGVDLTAMGFGTLVGRVPGAGASVSAGEINLETADGVLVRMMPPGSLEQVVFRMDALGRLAAAGVPVLNPPRAIEAAVDKYLSLALISLSGLRVPETWTGERARKGLEAFVALGSDVVMKPIFGAEGRGLVRLTDYETARRVLHAVERVGGVIYLQRFIPNGGWDLRAFVLGGRVLGAIRRTAKPGEWRANVAVGGRAEAVKLDPERERLALRAARAVGAEMAGVDLLEGTNGEVYVLEVNAVPGWRALAGATGVDVAAEILVALRESRP